MRASSHVIMIVCSIAFAICVSAQESSPGSHDWGYEGAEGPSHWGDLKPEYKACKLGQHQSPINIRAAQKLAMPRIEFHYKASPLNLINNGHAIQINYAPGSFIVIGDKRYELRQFHFHHPSEEEVNGNGFEMEAHLVHSDAGGRLAVVAVLFSEGSSNATLAKIWRYLPDEVGKERSVTGETINAASLLPQVTGYYGFDGSLTTPPCSEPVSWIVLKTPVTASAEQVAGFAKLYLHNTRPIQPLNGRTVLESQ